MSVPRATTASGRPGPSAVPRLADELRQLVSRPWTLMEVCGGQTHAIVRWGLDQLLPEGLRLIHGPGCPVCVTAAATIDAAQALARRPEVILCSYGDMLRVPGSMAAGGEDLLGVRAAGGDVRLLTSPLEAIALAGAHPERQVVFFAVGFETTAPATALLARQALALGLTNLSLLTAHVRVPPAMETILAAEGNQVQGFLAAGHVCSVMGTAELETIVARHRVPVVVTGFDPEDLMLGLLGCIRLLEADTPRVVNAYGRVVRDGGNAQAQRLLREVFQVVDRPWRGFGMIPAGGLDLRPPYDRLDARRRFGLDDGSAPRGEGCGCPPAGRGASGGMESTGTTHGGAIEPDGNGPGGRSGPGGMGSVAGGSLGDAEEGACISGLILQGRRRPDQCPAFGRDCTPEHPLGAPMVSSEGACAAYYRYRPRG